jgi:hypothetical protein
MARDHPRKSWQAVQGDAEGFASVVASLLGEPGVRENGITAEVE